MSGGAEVTSPSSTAKIETFTKVATGAFAVFFVFGLLISNIQLMEVGIADFASLQTRNVLIGFVFALYVAGLVLATVPLMLLVAGTLLVIKLRGKGRLIALAAMVVLVPFSAFGIVWILGAFGGMFLAWGAPYDFWYPDQPLHPLNPGSLSKAPVILARVYSQFGDLYLFKKILIVMGLLGLLAMYVSIPIIHAALGKISVEKMRADARGEFLSVGPYVAFVGLLYLIFAYANDVYPNVKYNLGGGQPDVAELALSGRKAELAGINADYLCCEGGEKDLYEAKKLGPIVIWHQSDKYFYISSLANVGKKKQTELTAVDLKLVRSVRYLHGYVKIQDGGQLVSVHSN